MQKAKPILFGLLWWVLISIAITIIGFNPQLANMGEHGFVFNSTGLIFYFLITIILSVIITFLYFRKQKGMFMDGIKAGLIVAITGLVLDTIITAPFIVKSYPAYFGKWSVWVGYIVTVLVFGIITQLLVKKTTK
jgi:hypothetical protein